MGRKKFKESKMKRKQRYKELLRKMADAKKRKNETTDIIPTEQSLPVEPLFDIDCHVTLLDTENRNSGSSAIRTTKESLSVELLPSLDSHTKSLDNEERHNEPGPSQKEFAGRKLKKRKISNCGSQAKKQEKFHGKLPYEIAFGKDNDASDYGHRLINMNYFIEELIRISSHASLFQCSLSTMKLVSEKKYGLVSKFLFSCSMCQKEFEINNSKDNLNRNAVEGAMVAGCGYAQLRQITAALDMPILSQYNYDKCHEEVCKDWEATAWEEMKKAGVREREAAIKEGRVNKDGIPLIDVIVDGCWCKRSYKTNYAALSGAAAIIGRRFGQVLFLSVKNKYCCICARAEKRGETVRDHECFRNYSGPSTGMEACIIAEGFKQSIEMHQVIYSRFIADGDSSTYAKILETRPYSDVTVEKINCRNHILRNFCNKFQQLKVDTKYSIKERKQITTEKILSARKYICDAIKLYNDNKQKDSVKKLHDDINVSVSHAFGNHEVCNENICKKLNTRQDAQDIFHSHIWHKIRFLAANVATHSRSLIENVDSNIVERFNGIIAKFVGGKRINYALKRSYQARCAGAIVSFNSGKVLTTVHKSVYQKSPSVRLKKFEENIEKQREYNKTIKRKKNRNLMPKKIDFNYGENVDTPDMDLETYEMAKTTFLKNLEKSENERHEIQERTILQSECGEWMELRRNLLTASNFGKVVKRNKTNSCANIVKSMLYKPDIGHVASISHGKKFEEIAIEQLSNYLKVKISKCGLFIDRRHPFLGATPDGIIDDGIIVEIKCPIAPFRIGIDEAIKQGKMHFWRLNKKTGEIYINKKSDWYMQTQGQLHITDKAECILAVWYGDNKFKTEYIKKDDQFWQEVMEPKLLSFYFDCLLPELVDPRFTRNKPIREPAYVIQKDKKQNENKENVEEDNITQNITEDISLVYPPDHLNTNEKEKINEMPELRANEKNEVKVKESVIDFSNY